jgi:hypothetical protein
MEEKDQKGDGKGIYKAMKERGLEYSIVQEH